ncbi:ParB/RepB/Spo0J family partition protein [Streptomyces sp. NPDC020799]|uniref:ParB/RepB/Spo0J family partition protein n=1 Tax=Streptomyces sp. NPDC020799 TaxID=3365091 RepID=UPI00348695F1
MSTVRTLKMSQVHPAADQPRKRFDPAYLEELKGSIKTYGLMQPIVVRPDNKAGGYEIVAGECRWRAHELAGKRSIRVIIRTVKTGLDQFKASMSENITRRDMTPLEEARGFQRILDEEPGATPESVAGDFSKTVQYVKLRLALLKLRDDIAKLVEDGHIGTQAAVQIAALNHANQGQVLAKFARDEFKSDNEMVHFAYAMRQQQDQGVLLQVEELTEDQRKERAVVQRTTRTTLDKIEMVRQLLEEIAGTGTVQLAEALGGQVSTRLDQLDRVAESLTRARFQLKQAKAHAEAAEVVTINPAAEAEGDEEQAHQDTRVLVAA